LLQLRNDFSAYDAAYVALAEQLEAVFVTSDAPLAQAVREHFPAWEVHSA
jgi:predicted nucleic acid-binding protein